MEAGQLHYLVGVRRLTCRHPIPLRWFMRLRLVKGKNVGIEKWYLTGSGPVQLFDSTYLHVKS